MICWPIPLEKHSRHLAACIIHHTGELGEQETERCVPGAKVGEANTFLKNSVACRGTAVHRSSNQRLVQSLATTCLHRGKERLIDEVHDRIVLVCSAKVFMLGLCKRNRTTKGHAKFCTVFCIIGHGF